MSLNFNSACGLHIAATADVIVIKYDIYEQETSACMCCTVTIKQKTQSLFDEFSYSFNT